MLHAHLHALEREHRNLEDAIRAEYMAHNDDEVRRLKVARLHLKEEIARIKESEH